MTVAGFEFGQLGRVVELVEHGHRVGRRGVDVLHAERAGRDLAQVVRQLPHGVGGAGRRWRNTSGLLPLAQASGRYERPSGRKLHLRQYNMFPVTS